MDYKMSGGGGGGGCVTKRNKRPVDIHRDCVHSTVGRDVATKGYHYQTLMSDEPSLGLATHVSTGYLVCILQRHVSALAEASGELDHWKWVDSPYCLRLYDRFHVGNFHYFVTDPVVTGNVRNAFERNAPKDVTAFLCLAAHHLMSALRDVHAAGFIHLDFDWSQVWMDAHHHLYLGGFHNLMPAERAAEMGVRSYPAYASPELLAGTGPYTEKADVWSVGVGILELLTGEWVGRHKLLANANDECPTTLLRDIRQLLPSLRQRLLDQKVDAWAADFLVRVLKYDPTERPTAAEALRHSWFLELRHPRKVKSLVDVSTASSSTKRSSGSSKIDSVTQRHLLCYGYEVMEIKYAGAVSTVFNARCVFDGKFGDQDMAIKRKTLKKAYSGERLYWQTIRHPAILKLMDVFQDGAGHIFFVTELMSNDNACKYLRGDCASAPNAPNYIISEEKLLRVTLQVVEALRYLHDEVQMVHLNFSWSNVLVDREGNAKLADFRFLQSRAAGGQQDHNFRYGQSGFRSPETFVQPGVNRALLDRVDTWALGASMLELLSGRCVAGKEFAPYRPKGQDHWKTYCNILDNLVKLPNALAASRVGGHLSDFIVALLVFRPEVRMSAAKARSHPWLATATTELPPSASKSSFQVNCMKAFDSVQQQKDKEPSQDRCRGLIKDARKRVDHDRGSSSDVLRKSTTYADDNEGPEWPPVSTLLPVSHDKRRYRGYHHDDEDDDEDDDDEDYDDDEEEDYDEMNSDSWFSKARYRSTSVEPCQAGSYTPMRAILTAKDRNFNAVSLPPSSSDSDDRRNYPTAAEGPCPTVEDVTPEDHHPRCSGAAEAPPAKATPESRASAPCPKCKPPCPPSELDRFTAADDRRPCLGASEVPCRTAKPPPEPCTATMTREERHRHCFVAAYAPCCSNSGSSTNPCRDSSKSSTCKAPCSEAQPEPCSAPIDHRRCFVAAEVPSPCSGLNPGPCAHRRFVNAETPCSNTTDASSSSSGSTTTSHPTSESERRSTSDNQRLCFEATEIPAPCAGLNPDPCAHRRFATAEIPCSSTTDTSTSCGSTSTSHPTTESERGSISDDHPRCYMATEIPAPCAGLNPDPCAHRRFVTAEIPCSSTTDTSSTCGSTTTSHRTTESERSSTSEDKQRCYMATEIPAPCAGLNPDPCAHRRFVATEMPCSSSSSATTPSEQESSSATTICDQRHHCFAAADVPVLCAGLNPGPGAPRWFTAAEAPCCPSPARPEPSCAGAQATDAQRCFVAAEVPCSTPQKPCAGKIVSPEPPSISKAPCEPAYGVAQDTCPEVNRWLAASEIPCQPVRHPPPPPPPLIPKPCLTEDVHPAFKATEVPGATSIHPCAAAIPDARRCFVPAEAPCSTTSDSTSEPMSCGSGATINATSGCFAGARCTRVQMTEMAASREAMAPHMNKSSCSSVEKVRSGVNCTLQHNKCIVKCNGCSKLINRR